MMSTGVRTAGKVCLLLGVAFLIRVGAGLAEDKCESCHKKESPGI